MMEPRNIEEWFAHVAQIPGNDEDCVILFTGVERSGKSNCAQLLFYRIDPAFGVPFIAFNVPDFFEIVRELPKGRAVLLDEAKVNARKAMTRETVELLDWLQVCGGLNHFMGLCFPRAHRVDWAIAERVRFNVHMQSREWALMRVFTGKEDDPWRELFKFHVSRLPDRYREPYLEAKEMAARAALEREQSRGLGGVDRGAVVADLRGVLRRTDAHP